jgi:hypothetical protein
LKNDEIFQEEMKYPRKRRNIEERDEILKKEKKYSRKR